ncbi:tRNA (N(6)-L-threonylcarbamoyladenosine(37)-C(2))-methylthiotransferase [Candidatus Woesearchaeota archaeon]|nr:tRNA (N(6)-L-threonylcarbamoyladenosine(37)-C(2))-methylthiotransferase [Candidatus Woesearchaeota archaeon]
MTSIHVTNYGCSANLSEAEAIKGILKKEGHSLENAKDSGVVILNVCTVKGDHQALRAIRQSRQENSKAKMVITGCVTRNLREAIQKKYPEASITNNNNLQMIKETVQKIISGEKVLHITGEKKEKANLPRIRTNPIISIIPISNGCLSTCSYCSTKQVKGALKSYPLTTIKKEFEESIREGCKEFWLTSQDNGCWGYDVEMNPAILLKEASSYEGDYRIRYGMTSPQHFMKNKEELLQVFHNEKIYKFLHLPVQSGSNKVLKDMKREYTSEEYEQLISDIKKEHPDITITTDIIVGYPAETEKDFEETIRLLKVTKPHITNISRFARREETTSSRYKLLPTEVVQDRSRQLSQLCDSITQEYMKESIGKKQKVLANNHLVKGTTQTRSNNYTSIVIPEELPLGTFYTVQVTGVGRKYCVGRRM